MHSVTEVFFAARFEIIAFSLAMLMYSLLASKCMPMKAALQKKIKVVEEPETWSSAAKANKKSSNKAEQTSAAPCADVAKHIVMIRKCASENNLKGVMSIFGTLKESG